MSIRFSVSLSATLVLGLGCCSPTDPPAQVGDWQLVASEQHEALLSVSAPSESNVWLVGADKGKGPVVVQYDGQRFVRHDTGHKGDLWWVQAFPDGTALMAGSDGSVLKFAKGRFERLSTPGLGRQTLFGLWGSRPDDVWFVGGAAGRDGFLWHMQGSSISELLLPLNVPRRLDGELPSVLKVCGTQDGSTWFVGDRGLLMQRRGLGPLELVPLATKERLFTVHATGQGEHADVVAVGGNAQGLVLEKRQNFEPQRLATTPLLQGTFVGTNTAVAVGQFGTVLERTPEGWRSVKTGLYFPAESLHAAQLDPGGNLWAVGGNVISTRLDGGAVLYRAASRAQSPLPPWPSPPVVSTPPADCPADAQDPQPNASIARRWNEQILAAIRRDLPQPTVHARNLFHLSAAIYDAWTAYDQTAVGYLLKARRSAADVAVARREAISYAAYRLLSSRYTKSVGGAVSAACFTGFMRKLGFDPADTSELGDSPRALGNSIARRYLETFLDDGANQTADYADTTGYRSVNQPLVVDLPSTQVVDPARWQQLNLSVAATQNGIVLPAGVQGYIGAHWGMVTPFALSRLAPTALYVDPGPPPGFAPDQMRAWVVQVLQRTQDLDIKNPQLIDISPGAIGNNSVGLNDGKGHTLNPSTGKAYAPNRVLLGDFGRVLAEHWADGPKSETPPGHWNVIANRVSDHPLHVSKLFGTGPVVDSLEWDVKVYLTLNAALHDAAVAAWEIKRRFDAARPLSLIRYMAAKGQSSERSAPDYSAEGLPLVPGLIERISTESSAAGARHEHLAHFVGELAVRGWRGEPGNRQRDVGGIAWIRAAEWLPYQRRNFVTPAFPGFISGHSTFSRAAAEVLTALTGTAFFPGGLAEYSTPKDTYLQFERGPEQSVALQWATYFDAADQAGQSRLWGGIHIEPDDFSGRRVGQTVGKLSIQKVRSYFAGTAPR